MLGVAIAIDGHASISNAYHPMLTKRRTRGGQDSRNYDKNEHDPLLARRLEDRTCLTPQRLQIQVDGLSASWTCADCVQ
jgi:hypothetical protein